MPDKIPAWKQADIICQTLEDRLIKHGHIYYDFMGIEARIKRAVIKAFLTPLYSVHECPGYKTMDCVRFENVKQDLFQIYKEQRAKYDKQVNDNLLAKQREDQANEEKKFYRKRTVRV